MNLVYNNSSIASDYNSNNTLTELNLDYKPYSGVIKNIGSALKTNIKHKDNPKSAALKMINFPNSINNMDSKVQHIINIISQKWK